MEKIYEALDVADLMSGRSEDEYVKYCGNLTRSVYEQIDDRVFDISQRFKSDGMNLLLNKFKGKNSEDMEMYRQKVLKDISEENDIFKKLEKLEEAAKEIDDFVFYYLFNNEYQKACLVAYRIDMYSRMLMAGATITEICKIFPGSAPGDVYEFAVKYLGLEMNLSEEEKKAVEEYNSTSSETICLKDYCNKALKYFDVPKYIKRDNMWKLSGEEVTYTTYSMASKIVGNGLSYPYFLADEALYYAQSFEELLKIVMMNFDEIHFNGVEKFYGCQEMKFINNLIENLEGR